MWRQNNPFLSMLAAIDDPDDAGAAHNMQQQQQQHHHSNNLKLPEFWPAAPAIWFARAELRFEVAGVFSEREKFAHAVNALPQDATRLVTDLIINPPNPSPYTALKERLLIAHQLSPIQKAAKILSMPAIGDRRPSQLLADLMEYCPEGEENTAFFRAAYIHRLPTDMQALLDGVEDGDLKELAQKADKLWAIRRPADSNLASVAAVSTEEYDDTITAVRPPFKKPDKKQKQNEDRGQRKPRMFSICYKHMKFGANAHRCDDPSTCTWQGN